MSSPPSNCLKCVKPHNELAMLKDKQRWVCSYPFSLLLHSKSRELYSGIGLALISYHFDDDHNWLWWHLKKSFLWVGKKNGRHYYLRCSLQAAGLLLGFFRFRAGAPSGRCFKRFNTAILRLHRCVELVVSELDKIGKIATVAYGALLQLKPKRSYGKN